MATSDVTLYNANALGGGSLGARRHQVAAQATPPFINAGELVNKTLGNQYVITCPTNGQAVATNFMAGISTSASTETASLDGYVDVAPISNGTVWLIAPTTPTNWNTQTLYNANVGKRVLIAKSATGNTGIYTIASTDSATNGCVVENLNIFDYPGLVAFTFRAALAYNA